MLMSCSLGCREEMGKLEKAYLKGEYTPFEQESRDVLKELPANPLGQLPPPAPSSSLPRKRKQQAGKENDKPGRKKSKGKKGLSIQVIPQQLSIISSRNAYFLVHTC